jgi:hypothetical protein
VTLLSSLRVQLSKLGCISEFANIQIYSSVNSKLIHKLAESLTCNVNNSSLVNLTDIKTYTLLFGCSTQSPFSSYDNTKCSIVVVSVPAARSVWSLSMQTTPLRGLATHCLLTKLRHKYGRMIVFKI